MRNEIRRHCVLNQIKAVVFDLDSTLVTSSLDFALIRRELGCTKQQDILAFIDELPEERQDWANQLVIEHELRDAHTALALPGCHQLLTTLNSLSLPTAIITRNCVAAAQTKLSNNQISIPLVLTREEFPAKPAPDALLHLAELWQLEPKSILYVGDYLYDVQTAANANSKSCLLSFNRDLNYADTADMLAIDLIELNARFVASQKRSA